MGVPAHVQRPALPCLTFNTSSAILSEYMLVQGKPYRPNVVRIGSEEAPLAQRAKDVWVDGLIRQYTLLHPEVHSQRMQQHIRAATQLSRTIAEIVTRLADTQDQVRLTVTL